MVMRTTTQIIGHIGVDAGLCWIGDPCYVLPDDASERSEVNDWDIFCAGMRGQLSQQFYYAMGHEGLGVCVTTGFGDGMYPVVANIIDDPVLGKRIASVTIEFITEEDMQA